TRFAKCSRTRRKRQGSHELRPASAIGSSAARGKSWGRSWWARLGIAGMLLLAACPTGTRADTPAAVEQTEPGKGPPAEIVASFDGLGDGFKGPQGTATLRNPSDNSLAVGPDHIVQIVNSKMAVFTKKG